jgi:hypothetical protein
MHFTLDAVQHTEKWALLTELHVVLEDGHKHAGDVERFYNLRDTNMTANR